MSGEVAEEEGREGWDRSWVQVEVYRGQSEGEKRLPLVASLSILPTVLKLT